MAPLCPTPIEYHIALPDHVVVDEWIDGNDEMLCAVLASMPEIHPTLHFRVRMRFMREHLIFWSPGNPAAYDVTVYEDPAMVCAFVQEYLWQCNCLPGRVEPFDQDRLCTLCD